MLGTQIKMFNTLKNEIADIINQMDIDPVLFLDLFVEQYVCKVYKEVDARSWGRRLWDKVTLKNLRDPGDVASRQYNYQPKMQEIMGSLNALEALLQRPNTTSQYDDQAKATSVFRDLSILLKKIKADTPIIQNGLEKIAHFKTKQAMFGKQKSGFQGFDINIVKKQTANIRNLEQLNNYIVKLGSAKDPNVKTNLLLLANNIDINDVEYEDARDAIQELNKYYRNQMNNLKAKLLQLSNNDSSLSDNLLHFLINQTSIPVEMQSGLDPSTTDNLQNVKTVQDVINYWKQLDLRQKNLIIQDVKTIRSADPSLASATDLWNKKGKGKFADQLIDLKNEIEAAFPATSMGNFSEKVLKYILSKTPIPEIISKGGPQAYGGGDPMNQIKQFDDIGNYFEGLSPEQKNTVEMLAQRADDTKEPMLSGMKVYDDLLNYAQSLITRSYMKINRYTKDTSLTKRIISLIIGQTALVSDWQDIARIYNLYAVVLSNPSTKTSAMSQMGWNDDIYDYIVKNPSNLSAIWNVIANFVINGDTPSSSPSPSRRRSTSGTP